MNPASRESVAIYRHHNPRRGTRGQGEIPNELAGAGTDPATVRNMEFAIALIVLVVGVSLERGRLAEARIRVDRDRG